MVNTETNSIKKKKLRSIGRQQISNFSGSKIDNLKIPNYEVNKIKSKSIEQLHQNFLKVFKTFKFILENNPLRCDCGITIEFFHERKYP